MGEGKWGACIFNGNCHEEVGEVQLSSDDDYDDEHCSQWQKSFAFINWLFAIHERNVNCGGCRQEGGSSEKAEEGVKWGRRE